MGIQIDQYLKNGQFLLAVSIVALSCMCADAQSQRNPWIPTSRQGPVPTVSRPGYSKPQPSQPTTQYNTSQPWYSSSQPSQPSSQYNTSQPRYPSSQPSQPSSRAVYPSSHPRYPSPQPVYPSPQPIQSSSQTAISNLPTGTELSIVVLPFSDNRAQYLHKPIYDQWGRETWESIDRSKKIADLTGYYPDRDNLRMMCESRLGKYNSIQLLTRENLEQVKAEHRFQGDDYWSADTQKIYEIGKALGAEYILLGNFSGSQLKKGISYLDPPNLHNYMFSLRLININSLSVVSGSASIYLHHFRSGLDVQTLVNRAVGDLIDSYLVSISNNR